MDTVSLSGPLARKAERIANDDAAGMAERNAWTPRWKSRLSYSVLTVASSGRPSKNFNVPSRVSTLSGVVIDAGMVNGRTPVAMSHLHLRFEVRLHETSSISPGRHVLSNHDSPGP